MSFGMGDITNNAHVLGFWAIVCIKAESEAMFRIDRTKNYIQRVIGCVSASCLWIQSVCWYAAHLALCLRHRRVVGHLCVTPKNALLHIQECFHFVDVNLRVRSSSLDYR